MDKHLQQQILASSGIGVPRSTVIHKKEWAEKGASLETELAGTFGYPFVTKPIREGSSVGVTIIRKPDDLETGVREALKWDNAVLVEEFLDGIEFSSIVMDGEDGAPAPLGLTEIFPQSEFYTYDDKYMPGRCRKFTPPRSIPREAAEKIKTEVVRAYQALGFRCYGRIDGFYLKDGRILITDPNSSSGMAPSSFFFEQAAEAGMLPSMIVSRLIEIALRIHREKKGPL
jgi:D-alanine-D-alanine ligase